MQMVCSNSSELHDFGAYQPHTVTENVPQLANINFDEN